MAFPNVYVFKPPVMVKPERFVLTQNPLSFTCPQLSEPDKHAIAIHTGCIPTAAGTDAMIVIVVIDATVPDPSATRNSAAITNAINSARIGEAEIFLIVSASMSAKPVALITAPNDPPAPVIKMCIRDSENRDKTGHSQPPIKQE